MAETHSSSHGSISGDSNTSRIEGFSDAVFGFAVTLLVVFAEQDVPSLMVMYGMGFVLLFAVLAAMHWRALVVHRRAGAPPALLRDIRVHGGASLVYVGIGLASVLIAAVGTNGIHMGLSGGRTPGLARRICSTTASRSRGSAVRDASSLTRSEEAGDGAAGFRHDASSIRH